MTKLGMEYRIKCPLKGVEKLENGMLRVNLEDGSSIEAE